MHDCLQQAKVTMSASRHWGCQIHDRFISASTSRARERYRVLARGAHEKAALCTEEMLASSLGRQENGISLPSNRHRDRT
jgi:hypothetical protein